MSHNARHAAPAQRRTPARILGLTAVAGLGLAAAPAAHAVTPPHEAAGPVAAMGPARAGAPAGGMVAMGDMVDMPIMDAADGPDAAYDPPVRGTQPAAHMGDMRLYPLAGTPFDLLSNNVRVPVGGMDLSTFPITAPFRDGLPLAGLPVLGKLLP